MLCYIYTAEWEIIIQYNFITWCLLRYLSAFYLFRDQPKDTIGATSSCSMRTRSPRNKDSGERCLFLSLSISFFRSLSSSLFRSVNLYAICTKIIIRVARSRSLINYCPPEGSSHWQVEGTVYSLSCVTYIATTVKKSKNRSISKIYRLFFFLSFFFS